KGVLNLVAGGARQRQRLLIGFQGQIRLAHLRADERDGGQALRQISSDAERSSDCQRGLVIFERLSVFAEIVPTPADAAERSGLVSPVSQLTGYRERLRVKLNKALKVLPPFADYTEINESLHFIATFAQLAPLPQRGLIYCCGLRQRISLAALQQLSRL